MTCICFLEYVSKKIKPPLKQANVCVIGMIDFQEFQGYYVVGTYTSNSSYQSSLEAVQLCRFQRSTCNAVGTIKGEYRTMFATRLLLISGALGDESAAYIKSGMLKNIEECPLWVVSKLPLISDKLPWAQATGRQFDLPILAQEKLFSHTGACHCSEFRSHFKLPWSQVLFLAR